tara:strand:+ start:223 stop:552 length:330 start_codon:yes stop_codon:yes gene_type:complete
MNEVLVHAFTDESEKIAAFADLSLKQKLRQILKETGQFAREPRALSREFVKSVKRGYKHGPRVNEPPVPRAIGNWAGRQNRNVRELGAVANKKIGYTTRKLRTSARWKK